MLVFIKQVYHDARSRKCEKKMSMEHLCNTIQIPESVDVVKAIYSCFYREFAVRYPTGVDFYIFVKGGNYFTVP